MNYGITKWTFKYLHQNYIKLHNTIKTEEYLSTFHLHSFTNATPLCNTLSDLFVHM